MLEHHIQKTIVFALAHSEGLRFSELLPEGVENKLFDYHLKLVIRDGLVVKTDDKIYRLSANGRRIWLRTVMNKEWFAEVAYSVLFLVVRRKSDSAWLMTKRNTHPLIGRIGFIHATPSLDDDISNIATTALQAKTGLTAEFSYRGSGYLKLYEDKSLESYTHFNMLVCDDATGDLQQLDENTESYWEGRPDFSDPSMVPNMKVLVESYMADEPFFIEETIRF